ncbi:hypothetical protein [Stutzerimonas kirkiae]|uniref:hypothetical protein n=1 Tax=Stutzerimonas kirkiae TaxID=2211392 RepID=UPI00103845E2|nr:hypothetical protein [Stutzerimonas kirkiae]TBV02119.1 hypothetical protein DNK08_18795 [Stutzerimonas kirkiae]
MRSVGWWLFWGIRAYIVFSVGAFFAFLIADYLVWMLRGQGEFSFYEKFLIAISRSWRLGGALTIAKVILIFIYFKREK